MKKPSSDPTPKPSLPDINRDAGLVALLSAAVFLYAHWPAFLNLYVINDDVRQQIFWMQAWREPGLFAGDLLAAYARSYVPWGVQVLYWLASWIMAPLTFAKVLPGLLCILLGVSIFQIGFHLGGRRLGWIAVGVSWLMPFFLHAMAGGLARGFAAPLLALFLAAWLAGNSRLVTAALAAMALCIPYLFPVTATAVLLAWVASRLQLLPAPPFPHRRLHLALLGAGAALVAGFSYQFTAAGFGPLVSAADMAGRPEFTAAGRFAIMPVPSLFWELLVPFDRLAPFRELGLIPGVVVLVAGLGTAAIGLYRADWKSLAGRWAPLGWVGLASLLWYGAARLFLLQLFIPDRYVSYSLNLFYCLLLAWSICGLIRSRRWPRGVWLTLLCLVLALAAARLRGVGLYDFSVYRDLMTSLARTEPEARIAGHPNLMDNVVTFAPRRAWTTYELAHPWARGYWQQIQPRLEEFFAAYYAGHPDAVRVFCRKYGISYLVVDDRHFTPDFLRGGRFAIPFDDLTPGQEPPKMREKVDAPFFAPFNSQIAQLVRERRTFAVLSNKFPAQIVNRHIRILDMRVAPRPPGRE